MSSPIGRQVSAMVAFQSAFASYPSAPTWQPLTLYNDSANEVQGDTDDPTLGRTLNNARDPDEPAPDLPQASGSLEAPLCLNEIGYWLKNFFGAPTTTGAGADKTHVFNSGGQAIPYLTLVQKIAADDWRLKRGIIGNTFGIRAAKEGGYPRVQYGVMFRDEAPAAEALAGTVSAAMALLRPPASRPIVRWNGTVMGSCLSASCTISNNLEADNQLDGEKYPAGFDPGPVGYQGEITMRYKDQTWLAIAEAGTYGRLEIEWAHPSAPSTRLINFDFKNVKLAKRGVPIQGPQAITATFQFSPKQVLANAACIVTLKNAIAAYA